MSWQYQTADGEKFLRKLAAEAHVSETEDIPTRMADQFIEEITEEHKEDDQEMVEVKKFRVVEHWSCKREVTVKAVDRDHAEDLAEEQILNADMIMSHKVHDDVDELTSIEKVPLKEIESGDYYESDSQ